MPGALFLQGLDRGHYDLLQSACSNAVVLSLVSMKSYAFADLDFGVEDARGSVECSVLFAEASNLAMWFSYDTQ